MRIYLIGLPGVGKSTLARGLARRLGVAWADTDTEVERATGRRVPEIFATAGEAAFRAQERAALEALIAQHTNAVIATGGGLPAEPGAMARLNETGLTVWLELPLGLIAQRLAASPTPRPLLQQGDLLENLSARLEARRPFYQQARLHLDARGLTAQGLAEQLQPYWPAAGA